MMSGSTTHASMDDGREEHQSLQQVDNNECSMEMEMQTSPTHAEPESRSGGGGMASCFGGDDPPVYQSGSASVRPSTYPAVSR